MPNESGEQGTVRYVRCPWCGTPNPGASDACSRCGKPLEGDGSASSAPTAAEASTEIICSKCRKALPRGSKFCGYCGAPLPSSAQDGRPVASQPPVAPIRPLAPPVAPKAPVAKPAPPQAPPPPPGLPSRPAMSRTSTPSQPRTTPPSPAASKAAPAGTFVFTGLQAPKIEASITEVKPDGSAGKTVGVAKEITIGSGDCEASYPSDVLLSPRHASVRVQTGKLLLRDQNSRNGTFLKQRQDSELTPGDVFLLGRELFRFATQALDEGQGQTNPQSTRVEAGAPKIQRGPITAKLEHIQLTGEVIEEFKLEKPETTLGRLQGDLVFKNDPYMSGTHARIVAQPGRSILQDLGSRNGIYRRIRPEAELREGDEFFLGEQLFRVEIKTS
jgi:pSer/pThr/pTyr-binding forkhead associated (FHA) protein